MKVFMLGIVFQLLLTCSVAVGLPQKKTMTVLRQAYVNIIARDYSTDNREFNNGIFETNKENGNKMYSVVHSSLSFLRQRLIDIQKRIKEASYYVLSSIMMYFAPSPSVMPDVDDQTIVEGMVSWAGAAASAHELLSLHQLRKFVSVRQSVIPTVRWYNKVKDVELLRFLRARQGNVSEAWRMITEHVAWRNTTYGADSPLAKHNFLNSPLHHEVFWVGVNKAQCPTLVIRTQVHDGLYYDHDLQVYESFIVSQIEKGRKLYGVGTQHQMCVLLDRGGSVSVDGQLKSQAANMTVVPRMVELVSSISNTLQRNYPDILHSAKIAPSSWFFSFCYGMISATLDAATLSKLEIIRDSDIPAKLHAFLDPALLPPHLGGHSSSYTSEVHIHLKKS